MKGGEFQAAINRSLYLKGETAPEQETPLSTENESSEFPLGEPVAPLSSEKSETIETIETPANIEPDPESKKSGWFEEL